jgi:hypothetical protein
MNDVLKTALESADLTSLREIATLPPADVIERLERMPLPAREAILGAVMLKAVADLDRGTRRLLHTWVLLALTAAGIIVALIK